MKFIVSKDALHTSAMVAHILEGTLKNKKDAWIALPGGQTFDEMYRQLVEAHQAKEVDFSQAHFLLVHEYVGLNQNHPSSVYQNLKTMFFEPCQIPNDHIHALDGSALPSQEASAFNQFIDAVGPLDLVISGLGVNGHIAYNQPKEEQYPRIHVEVLDETSRKRLSKDFDDVTEVPTQMLTLGLQDLLMARKLVLLVCGLEKSSVVKKVLDSKTLNCFFPASFLHLHTASALCADQDAAMETGITVEA